MDTTKTKILNIQTGKAEKNVKSLKTQIRELKEQMAGLEKNTEAYDRTAKQLADLSQKQIEINEAAKYSNQDLGATLSNLTKVSAGVVGAISSINSVMVLMGADSEEAMEAMKTIQSLMAIIQGLSAIDTATKALKGLTVAFKGFSTARGVNAGVTAGAATAELLEAGALAENTDRIIDNNAVAAEYNEIQLTNAENTVISTDAILNEAKTLGLNTAELEKNIRFKQTLSKVQKDNELALEKGLKTESEYEATLTRLNERLNEVELNIRKETDSLRQNIIAKKEELNITNANANAEAKETTATNDNTKSKEANAEATGEVVASETALGNTTKKNDPILRKAWSGLTTGIKNAAKALKSFIVSNPILAVIAGSLTLVAGAVALVAHNTKKALADLRAETELNNELNHTYEEENIRLNILLRTAKDETQS